MCVTATLPRTFCSRGLTTTCTLGTPSPDQTRGETRTNGSVARSKTNTRKENGCKWVFFAARMAHMHTPWSLTTTVRNPSSFAAKVQRPGGIIGVNSFGRCKKKRWWHIIPQSNPYATVIPRQPITVRMCRLLAGTGARQTYRFPRQEVMKTLTRLARKTHLDIDGNPCLLPRSRRGKRVAHPSFRRPINDAVRFPITRQRFVTKWREEGLWTGDVARTTVSFFLGGALWRRPAVFASPHSSNCV